MSEIDRDVARVVDRLNSLADGVDRRIKRNKVIKRKAARIVEAAMYLNAPKAKYIVKRKGKTILPGALKRSIKILPLRKSNDVFVGPEARTAPHAHLVEYGFLHHNGKFVQGAHFVKKTYLQTKELVLRDLINSAKREFEKYGREFNING